MAYGIQQIRKAGQMLNDLDTAYADAIYRDVEKQMGKHPGLIGVLHGARGLTSATPLSQHRMVDSYPENIKERLIMEAWNAGVLGTNIASRYALPAGGLTLAGVALGDLIEALGPKEVKEELSS